MQNTLYPKIVLMVGPTVSHVRVEAYKTTKLPEIRNLFPERQIGMSSLTICSLHGVTSDEIFRKYSN